MAPFSRLLEALSDVPDPRRHRTREGPRKVLPAGPGPEGRDGRALRGASRLASWRWTDERWPTVPPPSSPNLELIEFDQLSHLR